MHLARLASLASSIKQMVITLERYVTKKEVKLLKAKESIKTKDAQLRATSKKGLLMQVWKDSLLVDFLVMLSFPRKNV